MLSAANASVFDLRGARRISPPTYEADAVAFTEGADPVALWMGTAPSTAIDREENSAHVRPSPYFRILLLSS